MSTFNDGGGMPTEEEIAILNRIVKAEAAPARSLAQLLPAYARALAPLASKLTEEEMSPLIAIGARMHRVWQAELDAVPEIQELTRPK
jgi:hypothetical protein